MTKQIIEIGKRRITIFSDDDVSNGAILYLHMASADMEQLAKKLDGVAAVLVAIDQVDWNRELSPWPAKRAFRGGEDFGGGADAYLKELTETIVPAVEADLGFAPSCRILAGYSLAGLFALYALYRTDFFTRVGSISGSLWYDGFWEFMLANQPLVIPERVYFSLGDREKITRNQRLGVVEEHTIQAEQQLRRLGAETIFELNPGNHFDDAPGRLAKGLKWLV
ncbi:MAG: alpha/beta hydrolase [Acetobacterium woodii]|nr:alpha/beta hydrolase [Acetobacterium woodii]